MLPVGVKPPVGTTPEATPLVREKFKKYIGNFIDPEDTIEMVIGRPRLWYLKEARTEVRGPYPVSRVSRFYREAVLPATSMIEN